MHGQGHPINHKTKHKIHWIAVMSHFTLVGAFAWQWAQVTCAGDVSPNTFGGGAGPVAIVAWPGWYDIIFLFSLFTIIFFALIIASTEY